MHWVYWSIWNISVFGLDRWIYWKVYLKKTLLGPYRTSGCSFFFAKMVSGYQPLTISAKKIPSYMLDGVLYKCARFLYISHAFARSLRSLNTL